MYMFGGTYCIIIIKCLIIANTKMYKVLRAFFVSGKFITNRCAASVGICF